MMFVLRSSEVGGGVVLIYILLAPALGVQHCLGRLSSFLTSFYICCLVREMEMR